MDGPQDREGREGDLGRFVSLARDRKQFISAVGVQVSDVGAVGLADPQAEHPEERGQGVGLRAVVPGSREQRGVLQRVQHGPVLTFPSDLGRVTASVGSAET